MIFKNLYDVIEDFYFIVNIVCKGRKTQFQHYLPDYAFYP